MNKTMNPATLLARVLDWPLQDGYFARVAPAWLKPHILVMGAVFAGALAVGYMVLPGYNERIAALERDGRNREALRILQQRFDQGDRSQRTLFQLQRLHEHFGDLAKARQTLEMLAVQRPRDTQVQRQLAQFYKLTQNETGYVAALKSQLESRYSEPVCKELIGILRGNGDFAAEQKMIADCRQKGYRRPDDVVRLAYLVAADGNLTQASTLLRSVDDRRRLKVDRDRLLFFTAMLEAGQAEEAQKRALRWLKGTRDDVLVLLLIDNLAKEKRHDLAITLARETGSPGDSVSLAVAELMLDREEIVAARSYLKGWLETAKIRDSDLAQRFVAAALDAEDPELAYRGAESFGLKRLGQGELVPLAEALSAIGAVKLFQQVREAIDPSMLKDNPLLAAAIEVDRGAPEPARQLLSRVQVDNLDEWRLALWAKLMESTGRRATSGDALRSIGVQPLPPTAAPTVVIRRFKGQENAKTKYGKRRPNQQQQQQQQPQQPQPQPAAQQPQAQPKAPQPKWWQQQPKAPQPPSKQLPSPNSG